MATHLQLTISIVVISLCISTTSGDSMEAFSASVLSPLPSQELQEPSLSPNALLEPILSNLGFHELAMAVPSLSDSAYTTWNGPSTLFAPTDASIRSCGNSCSIQSLLREHIVPGIFSIDYLRKLAFGTKLETMNPGRCITVTSTGAVNHKDTNNAKIIFIGGVEITHPDLFNNGLVVIHRLEGFISALSTSSCNVERMSSPRSFVPPQPSNYDQPRTQSLSPPLPTSIMPLMLRDVMFRLHNNGFIFLCLALRVKYAEVVNLQNMTVFALEDLSIFSGGNAYVKNVRFHIVPNRLLMHSDLARLPAGTVLPTLEPGQSLVVTTAGGGQAPIRINYVQIKSPDVIYNLKIVVHSVFLPFPHIHPTTAFGGIGGNFQTTDHGEENMTEAMGSCVASEKDGSCVVTPSTPMSKATVEVDHLGL